MRKLIVLLAAMATFATSSFAQLGSLSSDLVFTPVTPCRIMDTRNPGSKSGILVAGSTRSFFGWSTTFVDQGGSATSCNSLSGSDNAAIVVNFTTVTPATAGFITAFPFGTAQPVASTVNFTAGSVIGNNATLKLSQGGANDFSIFTTSNVHVVADIVGYYAKPVSAGSLVSQMVSTPAVNVAANTYAFIGSLTCPAGYTAMSVGFGAAADVLMADGFANSTAGTGFIWVRNVGAVARSVTGFMNCIKIGGR